MSEFKETCYTVISSSIQTLINRNHRDKVTFKELRDYLKELCNVRVSEVEYNLQFGSNINNPELPNLFKETFEILEELTQWPHYYCDGQLVESSASFYEEEIIQIIFGFVLENLNRVYAMVNASLTRRN